MSEWFIVALLLVMVFAALALAVSVLTNEDVDL